MNGPRHTIPQEQSRIGLPLAPTLCRQCNRTGVPEPVLTCLGDLALRVGGWCKNCRRFLCVLEPTAEAVAQAPPWKFLTYDQRLPAEGVSFPPARRSFFDMSDFAFGVNEKEKTA